MELICAAMLLHKAHKEVNEANVHAIVKAAGLQKTDVEIKALVAALNGVDIDSAIKEASAMSMAAPSAQAAAPQAGAKTEEKKKEDDKKSEEQASAGLSSLFG